MATAAFRNDTEDLRMIGRQTFKSVKREAIGIAEGLFS